jgi:hypothetical protein
LGFAQQTGSHNQFHFHLAEESLMTEHTLAPIELNDDELLAVSGGRASAHAHSAIVQVISQSVGVAQLGGDVSVGGTGATSVTNATFSETFSATTNTNQTATNTNSGSATSTATATNS